MSRLEFDLDDEALERLADQLAERIIARLEPRHDGGGWLTTKQAAAHLGMSIDAVHKLTASRSIPFEQEKPGARCFFRRADLDQWRRT